MAKKEEKEATGSSFQTTETTAPVLEELKQAGWNIKEITNAGILMFSQAEEDQQRLFASIATRIINLEKNENARGMGRKWISDSAVDAQAYNEEMKQLPASKKKVSG